MRLKFVLVCVLVFVMGGHSLVAAPPLHFSDLPDVLDMFLPPAPPEYVPVPEWMPAPDLWETGPELPEFDPFPVPVVPVPVPPAPVVPLPGPDPLPVLVPEEILLPPVVDTGLPRGITDIAGHWAELSVLTAFDLGLVNMHANNSVRPNHNITRGEFAFALDRWIALNYAQLVAMGFSYGGAQLSVVGVPYDHAFRGAIDSLARMGMVGGDTPFGPDEYVQRQEVSRIWLNLFLRLPNSQFNAAYFHGLDVDAVLAQYNDEARIAGWARDAVAVMTDRGFMGGAGGNFRPSDMLTRAEAYVSFVNVGTGLAR